MHVLVFFLLIWGCETVLSAQECCKGLNVVINDKCANGSKINGISCKNWIIEMDRIEERLIMSVDQDRTLSITDEDETGTLLIESEK